MITATPAGNRDRRHSWRARSRRCAAWVIAGLPMLAHGADPQRADGHATVISESQIEQALQPPPKTRGLMVRAKTETKQMIDLNIPFEFNSSELQAQASAQLRQLQSALTSEALSKDRFLVAGHTDGKGSPQYNQQLSLRRAEAVKRYLVVNGVEASRLDAVGFGAERLALPDRPEDAANRRVEIRNLGEGQ
jgi:outer membrane protein OmpA-like peptidoglycan-associated protein